MARASAFQAEGRGFESRLPLLSRPRPSGGVSSFSGAAAAPSQRARCPEARPCGLASLARATKWPDSRASRAQHSRRRDVDAPIAELHVDRCSECTFSDLQNAHLPESLSAERLAANRRQQAIPSARNPRHDPLRPPAGARRALGPPFSPTSVVFGTRRPAEPGGRPISSSGGSRRSPPPIAPAKAHPAGTSICSHP